MKEALALLDRKSAALATAVVAASERADRGKTEGSGEAAKPHDTRTGAEVHRDTLGQLDAALAADRGDGADRRAKADVVKRQLAEAAKGRAQVMEVRCAAAFCKATLEEDVSGGQPMDVNVLLDTPVMRNEAMFGHETEGTRKRTTVYVAREGHPLPIVRQPAPELAGQASSLP